MTDFANTAREIYRQLLASNPLCEPEVVAAMAVRRARAIEEAIKEAQVIEDAIAKLQSPTPSPSAESPWFRLSERDPGYRRKCWCISLDRRDNATNLIWGFWNNIAGWFNEDGRLPGSLQFCDDDASIAYWTPYETFKTSVDARASFRQHHQK